MAIQTLSFISLILRPYVEQPISTDGWKTLFAQVDRHRNFDGELMAFGTMSGHDMDRIVHDLISFGYVGPDQGDKSDMIVSDMFMVQTTYRLGLSLLMCRSSIRISHQSKHGR